MSFLERQLQTASGFYRVCIRIIIFVIKISKKIVRNLNRIERRRLSLGKINNTPIVAAPSILLLIGIFLYIFGPYGIIIGASGLLIHEFAHVLEAKKHDIQTRHVLITAAGATAVMDVNEKNHFLVQPEAEWKVAIVGPLMSFILASSGYTVATAFIFLGWDASAPALFGKINLALGLFNLLPFLPLDGGRAIRGLLHEEIFTDTKSRLSFAKANSRFSFTWAWFLILIEPWMTIILLYVGRMRKKELENTIAFLKWQIAQENAKARNDLRLLHLYHNISWWKNLGMKDPPQTMAELKAAYRKAVFETHPDRGGSADKMRIIRTAYDTGMSQFR